MAAVIEYMHEIPGRLRVRCPRLRKDVEKTTTIRQCLESTAGVTSVTVNPTTGSFIIYYDHNQTTTATLLGILEEHGCRMEAAPLDEPVYSMRTPIAVVVRGRALSPHSPQIAKAVAGFVIEKAIERSLLALASAVL